MSETPFVSVTNPLTPALQRAKRMLFQPFDLNKWLILGLAAWLASLGSGPGSGTFFRFGRHGGVADLEGAVTQARDYIFNNLSWLLPLSVGIGVVVLAVELALLWLSSRGQFMLLDCVAGDKAEAVEPWNKFARQANSLFLFRICLSLIGLIVLAPLVGFGLLNLDRFATGDRVGASILGLIFLGSGAGVIGLILLVIRKLTLDFVVPLMALRRLTCLEGWRQFLLLASDHLGGFVLYLLFSAVLALVVKIAILAVVVVTCCVAGCLLALPYIGAVVLLPITLFWRSYSLDFLAQFGPDYDVFTMPLTGL